MRRRCARAVRWWWRRPARIPAWARLSVALVLGTAGLFGVGAQVSAGASGTAATASPGPLAAVGGPPTSSPNAPAKSPFGPGAGSRTTHFPDSAALQAQGMTLYENGCASCHGMLLQGMSGVAPSLQDVGAGPVDFYLSTGRMPLQAPDDEPERAKPAYNPQQIDALIAFITAKGGGPAGPGRRPCGRRPVNRVSGVHRALRRLSSDRRSRRDDSRRLRSEPSARQRAADRRGGPDGPVRDAAL